MRESDISHLDLNLLKVFSALVEEQSATAAGRRLKLAQSTISHSLARLREAFNDPLFVRSTRGLQPTPFALALQDPVARALDILQAAFDQHQVFNPATSSRTFNILLTDAGEMAFIPRLIGKIHPIAPRIRIVVKQLPRHMYKEALESGVVDLAVGLLPHGHTDLVQQVISLEPFQGYARVGHPILSNPTMENFMAADHLIVGEPAIADSHIQQALGALAAKRKVVLELRHFLPTAFALMQVDLVAIMPNTVSGFLTSFPNLACFPLPFEIEPVKVRQFWHARSTHDAGCKWLRTVIASLFMRGKGLKTPVE